MIVGQDRAVGQFASAWATRKLHHAWLLAGPKGVGKASFAHAAARRVLAEAAGPPFDLPSLETPDEHPMVRLVEAGSHPDMRRLERLVNEKTGNLARNISVDQVRELGEFLTLTSALSPWRAVVIDTVDELEASGANALLKVLEEPPANTLFFLVSHAPGRLLPTIRSRCRRLDFATLDDDAMTSISGEAGGTDRRRTPADHCDVGRVGRAAHWPLPNSASPNSRMLRSRSSARATRPTRADPSSRQSLARKPRPTGTPLSSTWRHR